MRKPTVVRPQICSMPSPRRCKAGKRRGSLPFVCPWYAYRELTREQSERMHIFGGCADTTSLAIPFRLYCLQPAMISKEEREELREELSNANLGFPLPWRLGEYADIVDDDGDAVADCMVENSFTGSSAERYIVAAANAAPKLLDALDAADKRIADLTALIQAPARAPA